MTDWRKRMTEDMQLKGMSRRTIEMYIRSIAQLSTHYQKSPDQNTEKELRQYFLYNKHIFIQNGYSRHLAVVETLCQPLINQEQQNIIYLNLFFLKFLFLIYIHKSEQSV